GAAMNDSATLTGIKPNGTITFRLYAPDGVTVVYTDTVSVNGNGTYYTASQGNSPGGYVPTATGVYHWVASYSCDKATNPVSSGSLDEPEQVNAASPTIKTTPGGTVVLGSGAALTDSATLSGGYNATGTITFNLYAPDGVTVVYTDVVTVVSGTSNYNTSAGTNPGGYVPAGPGTLTGLYEWVASYSGDANNQAAADKL